jgi:hypothetical protein
MRGAYPPLSADDHAFLVKLNRLSLHQSFDPELDVDWAAETGDGEFLALYDAWSLLAGSGKDDNLDSRARIDFARYQQANLMLFTGFLERYGLHALVKLYDDEENLVVVEALGHFVKEEVFHHTMFMRAIARLESDMPERPTLPRRHVQWFFRLVFAFIALVPFRRLRISVGFLLLEFAEEISIVAHSVSARTVPRKDSFAPRIWALHALDEVRHLRFDAFIRRRYRPPPPFGLLVKVFAAPLCLFSSLLLNANDVWAARQVGARVSLWHLPLLVKKTTAPFKRRVFSTVAKVFARAGA